MFSDQAISTLVFIVFNKNTIFLENLATLCHSLIVVRIACVELWVSLMSLKKMFLLHYTVFWQSSGHLSHDWNVIVELVFKDQRVDATMRS